MKYIHSSTKKHRWLACITIVLLFSACHSASNKHPGKREVTDMAGRTMLVPDTIHRAFMNKPGTLLLYAIDPKLAVCRTLWQNKISQPYLDSAYMALPYTDGAVEEIVKLKPEVILSYFTVNQQSIDQANALAEKTGIPVFMVEMNMTAYPKTFDLLGKLLHREAQTNRMDAFVHTYLDTISARAARIPDSSKVKVYYAEGDCGLQTDPSGSWHSQVIDFVGAVNVAKVDALPEKGMSSVSMEQILMWNPDVVVCWTGMGKSLTTYQCITTDKVWQSMRSVKNGSVYQIPYIPYGWIDRPPGTNRIIGTVWMANLLYPNVFPYNMREVAKEYFEVFYHRTLTEAELDSVLNPVPEGLLGSDGQMNMDKPQKKNRP